MLRQTLDRFCQIVRGKLTESYVNTGEVLAIERVKLRVVCGAVLGTVPPAPVTAFGRKERFFCRGERFRRRRAFSSIFVRGFGAGIGFARVPKEFPGSYVLAAADPYVKVRINPGCRE